MIQNIIVYILIAIALGGASRYTYRKLRALRKNKTCEECSACPLKEECTKLVADRKKAASSCCCHPNECPKT